MGYRLPEERSQFRDVATHSTIYVDNGTITRISIPCSYERGVRSNRRHRLIHDHLGWPSPDSPDDSCQLPPCNKFVFVSEEIDLEVEGYESIEVSFLDAPEGLEASGHIDYDTINVVISTMCESAETKDLEVPFSIYAIGNTPEYPGEESIQLRDVVTKGTLHIVAGPIG